MLNYGHVHVSIVGCIMEGSESYFFVSLIDIPSIDDQEMDNGVMPMEGCIMEGSTSSPAIFPIDLSPIFYEFFDSLKVAFP